jgi:hypothetical protein
MENGQNNHGETPKQKRRYHPAADPKVYGRTRLTNGGDVLPNIDQRTAVARRYRDIISNLLSDQGGMEACAEVRLQLIRRFAECCVLAEQMAARYAEGEQINVAEHAQLTSSMVRVAQRIGINRRSKNVTPTVKDYLEAAAVPKEAVE